MRTSNKIALIVLSCDAYSDLWPIFINQFEINWRDCPYDKYISTNHLNSGSNSFQDLKIGEDKSWSDGVRKALTQLKDKYEYALITLEDSVLVEKVDNNKFNEILTEFVKLNGNYLKFIKKPSPTNRFNSYFGEIKPGSLYRPTCVYALWKIETLLSLLDENENAWEFERFGSIRSDKYPGFYVVYEDFFKILNTIVKGKWVPSELKRLRRIGIHPQLERQILSNMSAFNLKFKTLIFKIFTTIIPWQYRRKIVLKIKHHDGKYHNSNI